MYKKTGSEILKRMGGESLTVQTQQILCGRPAGRLDALVQTDQSQSNVVHVKM